MARNVQQLERKINHLAVMASILKRKARDLDDKIKISNVEYNPYSFKPLGSLTKDLNEVIDLAWKMGNFVQEI